MSFELMPYLSEIISVSVIAVFMAISPGADFVMVARNSMFYGRQAGVYSAVGISLAIWIHVLYSIAGLALIISQSLFLFSLVKYLGAAYLIYIGWKTFQSKSNLTVSQQPSAVNLSKFSAFKIGFVTNALNPKTTMFFLSIFTQVVNPATPMWLQIFYGIIISMSHFIWFTSVSFFLSQPVLLRKFQDCKNTIEKVIGGLLMGFGLKVASISNG